MKTYHIVRPEDRRRIHCVTCGSPAVICEHSPFQVGNRAGISFWYYCENHDPTGQTR